MLWRIEATGSPNILCARLASSKGLHNTLVMALFAPVWVWISRYAAACVALPSSERASGDPNRVRPLDLSRAAAPASASAPLHVAHSIGDARSNFNDATAWNAEGSARICSKTR